MCTCKTPHPFHGCFRGEVGHFPYSHHLRLSNMDLLVSRRYHPLSFGKRRSHTSLIVHPRQVRSANVSESRWRPQCIILHSSGSSSGNWSALPSRWHMHRTNVKSWFICYQQWQMGSLSCNCAKVGIIKHKAPRQLLLVPSGSACSTHNLTGSAWWYPAPHSFAQSSRHHA